MDKPCEFDVMLVFSEIQNIFEVKCSRRGCPAGYAKFVKREGVMFSQEKYFALKKFLAEDDTECFSSFKFMKYFKENVVKAVENITRNDALAHLRVINISKEGSPAVTISIKANRKTPPIHVDLVFSVQINGWPKTRSTACPWDKNATEHSWPSLQAVNDCKTEYHLVTKQCPNPMDVSPKVLWRLSFSVAELKLMRPQKDGFQKQCVKVVKVILGCRGIYGLGPIKSYHLKMCFMHMMVEHHGEDGYWSKRNLGSSIIDLLNKMISGIEERKMEHFFIPSLNLYDGFSEKDLALVGKNLGDIIKELKDDPKQFCENILHSEISMY